MNNSYIDFGIMLGIWVAGTQLVDAFTLNLGYLKFSSMWAGVVALLVVGLGIAFYRKMKEHN